MTAIAPGLEPEAAEFANSRPDESPLLLREAAQLSLAISAKRQANALENIAHALAGVDAAGSIRYWLENIASSANAGVGR